MKKMKQVVVLLVVFAMLLVSITACGKKEESKDLSEKKDAEYNIAVLIPGSVAYFTATRAGADKAAEELGVKLSYSDANWDAAKQLSQIEDAISKNVDMIAVCAADAEGILPGIQAANDAEIPILTFTNAVGSDESGTVEGVVSYVGQSETETGMLCAEIAKELLPDGGNVVCIEGKPGTYPQIYRSKGFEEGIEGSNLKVVYNQTANWDKEEAMSITEDLIQKGTDIDLFFCQDDGMATGVGQVLEEAGVRDKIKVIGLGGSIQGLQALKDGYMDANTYMSAEEEGHTAIETCVRYLKGEDVEKLTLLKQVEVNQENVDDFKGEW